MVILPDAFAWSFVATLGRDAALDANYETLCAPRQELWNDYKQSAEQLAEFNNLNKSRAATCCG
jgi:hypothetical protein